jgi:SAM-dependent MidA family methyltransferase
MSEALTNEGGWLSFDTYMALVLYTPGLGYYSSGRQKFGMLPRSGSDFVTAPLLSPLFGRALAKQVGQALEQTGTCAVWEFGAGTGDLALQLLSALTLDGGSFTGLKYHIVELSANLRERQEALLGPYKGRVQWHDSLPDQMEGVVVGNEVLDAMPVKLAVRQHGQWRERGVALHEGNLVFADQPAPDIIAPLPQAIEGSHDYLTEVPTHALAFIQTLAERLTKGAAFFIDYGFPAHEYYHPQRHMGTLVCHHRHVMDTDPLSLPGEKDITAHVDFSAMALAWQDAGDALLPPRELGTLGFCNQARFLLNCGMDTLLAHASQVEQNAAMKLLQEHEMGELFKVLGLYVGAPWAALGFQYGDRSPTL